MRIKMLKSEKGFSIVELLIAVFLLTVGLLAAAGMQTTAINSNGWANRFTVATSLAQEVMDDLMAQNSTDAVFQTDSTDNVYDFDKITVGTQSTVTIAAAGTFNAKYTIRANQCSGVVVTNVTTVSVTASTPGRDVTLTSCKRAN